MVTYDVYKCGSLFQTNTFKADLNNGILVLLVYKANEKMIVVFINQCRQYY